MAQQGSSNFGLQRGVDPPWTPPTQTYGWNDETWVKCVFYNTAQDVFIVFEKAPSIGDVY